MTEAPAVPDWIYPGAPVVVYVDSLRRDSPEPQDTTVEKVAKLSFTIKSHPSDRFKIADQRSRQGDGWHVWWFVVVPADSEEAAEVKATDERFRRVYKAHVAVEDWQRDRTRGNRLAAIAALQEVED